MAVPNQVDHRRSYNERKAAGLVQQNPKSGQGIVLPPPRKKRRQEVTEANEPVLSLAQQLGLQPKPKKVSERKQQNKRLAAEIKQAEAEKAKEAEAAAEANEPAAPSPEPRAELPPVAEAPKAAPLADMAPPPESTDEPTLEDLALLTGEDEEPAEKEADA